MEEGAVRSHRDLVVWRRSVDFATAIYRATEAMPKSELYGLTGQVRRAAVSVAANIAEGSARRSTPDLLHFLVIAKGSLREVDTLLEFTSRLNFGIDTKTLQSEGNEIGRLLSALIRSVRT